MGHGRKKCSSSLISLNSAIYNFNIVHKLLRLLKSANIDTSLHSLGPQGFFSLGVLCILVKCQTTNVGTIKRRTRVKAPKVYM